MRFSFIPFLLLIVPVLEIAVFILVGGEIGIPETLGLILLTAIIGTVLLRVQGIATLTRIRANIDAGRMPGRELGDGAMIMAAGILLLTPGFLTDSIGFLLFVPAVRQWIWDVIASQLIVVSADHVRKQPGDREGVVELDPDEFSERQNPDSPWRDVTPRDR